ncbi:MAG: metallophosphoesterase [Deltaproteobacteria bacterium]|nr:metallophosphoesterase [Deltaproteobacteria bacterium]
MSIKHIKVSFALGILLLAFIGTSCGGGTVGQPDGDGMTEPDSDGMTEPDGDGMTEPDGDGMTESDGDGMPESDGDGMPESDGDGMPESDGDGMPESDDDGCGDYCDEFSIILIPDTQYYTDRMSDNADNTYYKQMQWIVDKQDEFNIKFVIHLGDITNHNLVAEWNIADQAHAILDSADVPYSVVPGNHDYFPQDPFLKSQTKFNDYFGPERFQGRPWYGGSYGSRNDNNYTLFEIGPMKFLVLSVEYAPSKNALCWANNLISSFPDRRVIIATHCYLTHNGNYAMSCADYYDIPGGSGLTVWDELASRHSNVFMVVCGHVGDSEYVVRPGNNGNSVHQMLADYQFEAACSGGACDNHCWVGTSTGNGWLRRLVFAPQENKIYARTHTVETGNQSIFPQGAETLFCSQVNVNGHNEYDQDPSGLDHNFSFDYNLTAPLAQYEYDDLNSKKFNDRTVNSRGAGDQLKPSAAMNPTGDFVVVWEDDSDSSDGPGNYDIVARGFQPGGCEGFHDITVNGSVTRGQQNTPSVAMDSGGNFVVVWRDDNDENDIGQIYARGFDSAGSQNFSLMTVNSEGDGRQRNPAVAMTPDGSFVVVWEDDSDSSDGSGNYDIFARGFHPDGTEKFHDIVVNDITAGPQNAPSVAMDSNGNFVVVWRDDNDENEIGQIYARGFNAAGAQKFDRMTVNSVSSGRQRNPVVGMAPNGSFVVAWEDDSDSSDGSGNYDILARGFDSNGLERFTDITVNTITGGQQLAPAISLSSSGGFAVTWEDDMDDNGWFQVLARGFGSNGAEQIPYLTVNGDSNGQQLKPNIAMDSDGNFVIAWQDDMDNNNYYQILARGLDW